MCNEENETPHIHCKTIQAANQWRGRASLQTLYERNKMHVSTLAIIACLAEFCSVVLKCKKKRNGGLF